MGVQQRIRVIYAGGTIGMIPGPTGLTTGIDLTDAVGQLLARQRLDAEAEVGRLDPLIDSSSATPTDWQKMADAITAHPADGYVVLHGTDTMAYSASALAYALAGLDAPIVVTGAQRSILEMQSDADDNIAGALALAAREWRGVGLYFDHTLFAAARTTKVSSSHRHAFDSPATAPWWTPDDSRLPSARLGVGWPNPAPYRACDIAVVSLAPGLTTARLRAAVTPRPEAVLIRAFGAGNGPEGDLADLVADLTRDGVPVAVTSQCLASDVDLTRYATGHLLASAGAFGTGSLTVEAAYAKLTFLLSQGVGQHHMARWMLTDLAGELNQSGR